VTFGVIPQAAGLFAVTNFDDIVVLSLVIDNGFALMREPIR
jgi:hypothetical protein